MPARRLPVQRPEGQMRHLPGPRTALTAARPAPPPSPRSPSPSAPRRVTSGPAGPTGSAAHRGRPARRGRPPGSRSPPSSPACPARVERPQTRPDAGRQTPQHAHPARRTGTAGVLHPHRPQHLQTQPAVGQYPLDKPARPLTSRLWPAPLTGSGCREYSYGGFGEATHTSTRMLTTCAVQHRPQGASDYAAGTSAGGSAARASDPGAGSGLGRG